MHYKCLSIAGFDGSGGAGIQADIKTFSALGCYAMTVLTALPIQNTCGVKICYPISEPCVKAQLQTIFEDIVPDCIKIGMLYSASIIELVAHFLEKNAGTIPIILDPVMFAKSADPLLLEDAIETLKIRLIPFTTLLTPNLPEARKLTAVSTDNLQILGEALLKIGSQAVFLKGGHTTDLTSNDLFLDQTGHLSIFKAPRIISKNTHGTGCTLSAAICAFIARGFSIKEACWQAKCYLFGAIKAAKNLSIGRGCGPVHHFYRLKEDPAFVDSSYE